MSGILQHANPTREGLQAEAADVRRNIELAKAKIRGLQDVIQRQSTYLARLEARALLAPARLPVLPGGR